METHKQNKLESLLAYAGAESIDFNTQALKLNLRITGSSKYSNVDFTRFVVDELGVEPAYGDIEQGAEVIGASIISKTEQ